MEPALACARRSAASIGTTLGLVALVACAPSAGAPLCRQPVEQLRPQVLLPPDPTLRNVLLIGIDTLRRDAVGRYGGGGATPRLDALLDSAVVLDAHYSCSNWTLPSALCLASGQTMVDLGSVPMVHEVQVRGLPVWLAEAGLATTLVSSNPYIGRAYATGADFEQVRSLGLEAEADEVVAVGLRELDRLQQADEPWFLQLHFVDPHSPYDPPPAWDDTASLEPIDWDPRSWQGVEELAEAYPDLPAEEQERIQTHVRALYEGEVRSLDAALGELMVGLEQRGALDHTLLVLWSDHGEQFWEHRRFQHGRDLHVEEVAGIAAFVAPGLEPAAMLAPTSHVDVAPSVLQALDLPPVEGLSGAVLGTRPADRLLMAHKTHADGPELGITSGERRLLLTVSGDEPRFYRTDLDPGEVDNRFAPQRAQVDCLLDRAAEEIARFEALVGQPLSGL